MGAAINGLKHDAILPSRIAMPSVCEMHGIPSPSIGEGILLLRPGPALIDRLKDDTGITHDIAGVRGRKGYRIQGRSRSRFHGSPSIAIIQASQNGPFRSDHHP